MLGFSEYLQNFMKTNSISMVELSKETDIDRTVIYRYVKGTRIPSDMDTVARMADAMQMSVSEKKYLLREYDKLVFGKPMVYSYQYIKKLLRSLERPDGNAVSAKGKWKTVSKIKMDAPVIELMTKEEIITYILDLFRYVAGAGNASEKIFLVMQPVYDEIQRFIPQIFSQCNVRLEQIVCMEQNINQSYKNLEAFYGILPLCFLLPGYDVYYYYDSLSNHLNTMTSMPNILIVQDYVVQFDYEMEQGFVLKSDTYAAAMRRQYDKMRKESYSLLVRGKNPEPERGLIMQADLQNGGCFFEQLCMGICLDRNISGRVIRSESERAGYANLSWDIWEDQNEKGFLDREDTEKNFVSYGSLGSLEKFLKTGKMKEFPERLCAPLSLDERMLVLGRMISLAKSGRIHYRILSDKMELPERIQICWDSDRKRVALNQITEKEMLQVVVEEQSIYRTFQLYLEYLEKKGLILGESESLSGLIKLQKKYEKKYIL